MLSYLFPGSNDLHTAEKFYDAVLSPNLLMAGLLLPATARCLREEFLRCLVARS